MGRTVRITNRSSPWDAVALISSLRPVDKTDIQDVTEVASHPEAVIGATEWGSQFILFKNVTEGIGLLAYGTVHEQQATAGFFEAVLGNPDISDTDFADEEFLYQKLAEVVGPEIADELRKAPVENPQMVGVPETMPPSMAEVLRLILDSPAKMGLYFWEGDRLEKFLATKRS